MKKVKVFEEFLRESLSESNIKVGDTVSRKFMGEDPTQTFKVISISGGKAKLKDNKSGQENGMYLSDLIKEAEESSELNEAVKVEVSLRHARNANDLFDDMFKDYGKKLSTDVFSFKDGSGARDFIRMMIKNLQIPAGEITADQKYFN